MSLNFRVAPSLILLSLLVFSHSGFSGGFSVSAPTPITTFNPVTNTGYQGGSTTTASSDSSGGSGSGNTDSCNGLLIWKCFELFNVEIKKAVLI